MIQKIYTGYDAMTLKISVSTQGEQDITLIVRDSEQSNTVLTNRGRTINGAYDFYVRMPLVRKYCDIIIVNSADGSDSSFKYLGCEKVHLEKRLDVIDFSTYYLNSYIRFIQKFCYNAGVLRCNNPNDDNDFYRSEDWRFLIKYLPVIVDYQSGEELTTPARISCNTGIIEVSQKYFIDYTVPMRMATLLHEYSHPFVNADPDDESEADLNGLIIYLGLGYPRIEAAEAWCEVFMNSPTDQNQERIRIIKQFIDDFENNKVVFYGK
jgi:hypothetical protein